MAMKCPACGGFLDFDPETQKLKCPYCESVFDAQEYDLNNEAEKQSYQEDGGSEYTVDVYSCKHCGAELCAPEEQIVASCMYCGGQATLLKKAVSMQKPVGMIPFKINKKSVCDLYTQEVSHIPFVPRQFKKSQFLEGFRGIYIPYWKFSTEVDGELAIEEGKKYTNRSYEMGVRYNVKAKCSGHIYSGTFDGSEAFDDTIAAAISPYEGKSVIPFSEAFLSGFYADMATVDSSAYSGKVETAYPQTAQTELKKHMEGIEAGISEIERDLKPKEIVAESHLFPVWFLTWRKGKRVCYSAMNGQTGALSVEIPVDYVKFFLYAIVISAVISGLMSFLPVFVIPLKVSTVSSFLLLCSGIIFGLEVKNIREIENHVYDIGYQSGKKKKVEEDPLWLQCIDSLLIMATLAMFIAALIVSTSYHALLFFIGAIFLQLVLFIRQCMQIARIQNKVGFVPAFISLVVQVAGVVIAYKNIQADIYYYGVSVGCLVAMIINIIASVLYTSYLTTRPVPNFYTREGANNGR